MSSILGMNYNVIYSKNKTLSLEEHIFMLSLITEGATEKVSQFVMSLKSIHKKDFVSMFHTIGFLSV